MLSVIVPVLNSHEIVRRQLCHWMRMGLQSLPDVEVIYVDDGSDPPHENRDWNPKNFQFIQTHDTRPWTWALARNRGAKEARGDYYLMTDLDYIISRELLDKCRAFRGDKLRFRREFGVLLEDGTFTQDMQTLIHYGLNPGRVPTRGVAMPPHPNNFCIKKDVFWAMGGYREDLFMKPYPQGEDRHFKAVWHKFVMEGKAKEEPADDRPMIYMFPNGQFCAGGDVDTNPFGLFHTLTRKTDQNYWYLNPRH